MIGFSSLLQTNPDYSEDANALFSALDRNQIPYRTFEGAKDIWARDYMPVKKRNGEYISFCYKPSYLKGYEHLQTDFKKDILRFTEKNVVYSDVILDGGNVVFSPSKQKAIVSDRVFTENPHCNRMNLIGKLENLLKAQIIVIPSLKSDMTGHSDGTVRFVDENTVLINATPYKNGYEQKVKSLLKKEGISAIDFPFSKASGISAVGLYLNYLEFGKHIFLPVFDVKKDENAVKYAEQIWNKKIVPVKIKTIAENGGGLNCISCNL